MNRGRLAMGGKNDRFQQSETGRRSNEEAFLRDRAEQLAKRKQREAALDTGVIFTKPAEPKSNERLHGDVLATAAMLFVVAIMLWFMPERLPTDKCFLLGQSGHACFRCKCSPMTQSGLCESCPI